MQIDLLYVSNTYSNMISIPISTTCHMVSETNEWPAIFIWKHSFYFVLNVAWKRNVGETIVSFYSDCIIINQLSHIHIFFFYEILYRNCHTWLFLSCLLVFTCHPSIHIFASHDPEALIQAFLKHHLHGMQLSHQW